MIRDDIWVRAAFWRWEQAAAAGLGVIVVPDVRFENEARQIRSEGGEVWMIHRPGVEPVAAHQSEAGLPLRLIDRLIVNDGTVDQLRERVEDTFRREELLDIRDKWEELHRGPSGNSKPAGSAA